MIIDYTDDATPSDIEADLCIIGAGAAGIAIARSFIATATTVCLVEGGGPNGEPDSQQLYEGASTGALPLDAATSRLRAFGGSCNLWGGGCIPLAELDLAPRAWVPHSGWPLSHAELEPYYRRARSVCGIDAQAFEAGSFLTPLSRPPLPFDAASGLVNRTFICTPLIFGDAYRAELQRASNITVLLHANLMELKATPDGSAVRGAAIGSLGGRRGTVRARHYVLACGGLENARALLLSDTVKPNGLGNDHDVVGRYFMDHPSGLVGTLYGKHVDRDLRPYDRRLGKGATRPYPEIGLSEAAQRTHQVLNARVHPFSVEGEVPRGLQALRQLRARRRPSPPPSVEDEVCDALNHRPRAAADGSTTDGSTARLALRTGVGAADIARTWFNKVRDLPSVRSDHIDLVGYFEQAPQPHSRVMLDETRDALGLRRIRVHWQFTELDRHSFRTAARLFGDTLARACSGRFEPAPWVRDDAAMPPLHGTAHHLGTTRMADDPRHGVVDRDCRVHGMANLHVAGSSVFPTGGWAFPTLAIVALSLRLADQLKARLQQDAAWDDQMDAA